MADRTAEVERHGLNYVMGFDHVVQVHADGTVTDDVPNVRAAWAPELTGDSTTGTASLDSDDWSMVGWSGQQGGGHVMHNSEFIGGGLERLILETPGYYVAVYCTWSPDECTCTAHVTHMSHLGTALYCETEQNAYCNFECECGADDEDNVEGWAVAYRDAL